MYNTLNHRYKTFKMVRQFNMELVDINDFFMKNDIFRWSTLRLLFIKNQSDFWWIQLYRSSLMADG